jgi:hypothetical protein
MTIYILRLVDIVKVDWYPGVTNTPREQMY